MEKRFVIRQTQVDGQETRLDFGSEYVAALKKQAALARQYHAAREANGPGPGVPYLELIVD